MQWIYSIKEKKRYNCIGHLPKMELTGCEVVLGESVSWVLSECDSLKHYYILL